MGPQSKSIFEFGCGIDFSPDSNGSEKMNKKLSIAIISILMIMSSTVAVVASSESSASSSDEVEIVLSDSGITVDGETASTDSSSAVYVSSGTNIIYYGTDTEGAGSGSDIHDATEASEHTLITITEGGTYRITGTLSYGQIAVSAGDDETVTLILDNVSITCTIAPAIIFYSALETGDSSTATTDISDTAGANIVIADDSTNYVNGSYVAKIYKTGTTSKLYKFDGAIYSLVSMIISGESEGNGILYVVAENEGIDSELHLTINGGYIDIEAQNDGINTNEDDVSVTVINGGVLTISAGLGDEGDGIDSNGYIIINGGTIITAAKDASDGGLDASLEIIINGGTILASGSSLVDTISSNSSQASIVLMFSSAQSAGSTIVIKTTSGTTIYSGTVSREFVSLTFSSEDLSTGSSYYIYINGTQIGYGNSNNANSTFTLSKTVMTFNNITSVSSSDSSDDSDDSDDSDTTGSDDNNGDSSIIAYAVVSVLVVVGLIAAIVYIRKH